MAAADISRTEWGLVVGGTGTDATSVSTSTLRVKAVAFAGNADNATCSCTTVTTGGVTAISCFKFKTNANDLDAGANKLYFGENGVPMTNLTVTLSHADDRLYVYLC